MSEPARAPGILFTAFEPSGDDHASAVIRELRRRYTPDQLPIYAWGGPKMEAAGAVIIERTGQNAVMGVPGVEKVVEHHGINRRIRAWLSRGLIDGGVFVPVDSPAANFPVCQMVRRRNATNAARSAGGLGGAGNPTKIVHLVAPQVWAWASWRIRKLRRLTDLVLCLLPFEEQWFLSRGVQAKFIGHPLFDHPVDPAALEARAGQLTGGMTGSPKIALMPGSRPAELTGCFPILLDAFKRLTKDFPETIGVVAATRPEAAETLRGIAKRRGGGGWPARLHVAIADTDAVIRWCDYALVVSGTVTLQIARQSKPMVAVYRPNRLMYYTLGKWLVSTELFTLPNLIAGKRVIPEFIPHFGDGEEPALEIIRLMRRTGYADDLREALAGICRKFEGKNAAEAAADAIEQMAGFKPSPAASAQGVAGSGVLG